MYTMPTFLDTERIITEVKLHPIIWNTTLEEYKSKDARTAAWRDICKTVIEDFERMSKEEQKTIAHKVHQRWKTARDCYIKTSKMSYNKLRQGKTSRKTYIHANLMTFLDSNSQYATEESSHPPRDVDTSEDSDSRHSLGSEVQVSQSSTQVQDLETLLMNETSETSRSGKKRKHKTEISEQDKQFLNYIRNETLEEDDLDFFKSLGPTLKTYSPIQKLHFRAKVLELMISIDQQNSSNQLLLYDENEGNNSLLAKKERKMTKEEDDSSD